MTQPYYLNYLYRHMELECIQVIDGDLAAIPCANPEAIPQLYVVRHHEQYHVYFRQDITERHALMQLTPTQLHSQHERVKALLPHPITDLFCGKSYVYPALREIKPFLNMTYFEDKDRCGIVIDEVIASQCMSIRANDNAAEAYVETHPDFRRRGLGQQVVQAWLQRVLQSGRLPYYSHKITNIASQRLAESLGFIWYMDDVGYE